MGPRHHRNATRWFDFLQAPCFCCTPCALLPSWRRLEAGRMCDSPRLQSVWRSTFVQCLAPTSWSTSCMKRPQKGRSASPSKRPNHARRAVANACRRAPLSALAWPKYEHAFCVNAPDALVSCSPIGACKRLKRVQTEYRVASRLFTRNECLHVWCCITGGLRGQMSGAVSCSSACWSSSCDGDEQV